MRTFQGLFSAAARLRPRLVGSAVAAATGAAGAWFSVEANMELSVKPAGVPLGTVLPTSMGTAPAPAAGKPATAAPPAAHERVAGVAQLLERVRALPADLTTEQLAAAVFADAAAAGRLLYTPGLLPEALQQDAAAAGEAPEAQLDRILDAVCDFYHTPEADGMPRVVNTDAVRQLEQRLTAPDAHGTMAIFTGPTSVAKTLVLHKASARLKAHKHVMLIVDGRRTNRDLVRGLATAITEHDRPAPAGMRKGKAATEGKGTTLRAAVIAEAHASDAAIVSDLLRGYTPERDASGMPLAAEAGLQLLVSYLIKACRRRGEYPIFVIDAAELVFKDQEGDPSVRRRSLAALELFTRNAKQTRQSSLVVASADEHLLEAHLQRLGFRTAYFLETMVMGEAPAADMRRLLTETWGCGERLASALLAMYGGNVYMAAHALSELRYHRQMAEIPTGGGGSRGEMQGLCALGLSAPSAPWTCLSDCTFDEMGVPKDAAKREQLRARVKTALRALAVDGFYPLGLPSASASASESGSRADDADELAELFTRVGTRVGFVIPFGATLCKGLLLPAAAWEPSAPAGGTHPLGVLVPSSHAMRLLLADKVSEL